MGRSISITLPLFRSDFKHIYFKGYVSSAETTEHSLKICVTKFANDIEILKDTNDIRSNTIYGYCGELQSKIRKESMKFRHWLELDSTEIPKVNKLILNNENINTDNCIVILYEHDKILNSEVISACGDFFGFQTLVQSEYGCSQNIMEYKPILEIPNWLSSSMFIQHILNYINIVYWLGISIKNSKKIFIKQGNLILAIVVDLLLGYFALTLLTQDKKKLSLQLMGVLEELIKMLESLLNWLMGSPAGFKLNNEFNKMLGKYFSYHVQLWWLFLEVSGEKLETILHMYNYMGYLGFTFQAAVISDMICIATFHSYCIYVYAARMFNLQVSGLIALLRFFVGRKYNPLRGGIDSCEYTNQELFVGTVAFTILLLLLPTTAMYYVVFTLFRILSLAVQYILAKLIYIVQSFPLYALTLWLIGSPRVAGNVRMEVLDNEKASHLILKLELFRRSFWDLVINFKSPVDVPKHPFRSNILSNVFVGKQIN